MAAARQRGFDWDDVKKDKLKTHYLGNTVKAATGSWTRHHDPLFYTKQHTDGGGGGVEYEKLMVKLSDDIKRNEMLGLPAEHLQHQLDQLIHQQQQQGTDNSSVVNNNMSSQPAANADIADTHKSHKHKREKHKHHRRSRSPIHTRHDRHSKSDKHKRSRSRSPRRRDRSRSR